MAAPTVLDTVTHNRTIRVSFDRFELMEIVATAAANAANLERPPTGAEVKITFEDETAGSPPYKVGTRASVVIKIDMAADAPSPPRSPPPPPPTLRF